MDHFPTDLNALNTGATDRVLQRMDHFSLDRIIISDPVLTTGRQFSSHSFIYTCMLVECMCVCVCVCVCVYRTGLNYWTAS